MKGQRSIGTEGQREGGNIQSGGSRTGAERRTLNEGGGFEFGVSSFGLLKRGDIYEEREWVEGKLGADGLG
jgi:hypothetical protein